MVSRPKFTSTHAVVLATCLSIFVVGYFHLYNRFRRLYILSWGKPSIGTVQKVYDRFIDGGGKWRLGHFQTYVVFSYSAGSEKSFTAEVPVRSPSISRTGQQVKVHYLPDKPEEATLDDDFRETRFDLLTATILFLTIGFGLRYFFVFREGPYV
jgi:hypothetical protein